MRNPTAMDKHQPVEDDKFLMFLAGQRGCHGLLYRLTGMGPSTMKTGMILGKREELIDSLIGRHGSARCACMQQLLHSFHGAATNQRHFGFERP